MGGSKRAKGDPRGHSIRVYDEIYDSPAWAALTGPDVLAYLALVRDLRGSNNGDLSLPLSVSTHRGIKHPKTLARSLRALCAVGLIAITRIGGCAKGGQRLATLYRVTDIECFENPRKSIEAQPATNDWRKVTSREHGKKLIAESEMTARKTKGLGHAVPHTGSPGAPVRPKTRARSEPWTQQLGYAVNMAENVSNPMMVRVTGDFPHRSGGASHRAPRIPPLHTAIHRRPDDAALVNTDAGERSRVPSTSAGSGPHAHHRFRKGSTCAILFAELRTGPKTVKELKAAGVTSPRQRVQDLRRRGHQIDNETGKDGAWRYVLTTTPPAMEWQREEAL